MLRMTLAGVEFKLDPSAVSCLRFRAEYGDSAVNLLARCRTVQETEGQLLRLCHSMIPPGDRPELLEFAALARKDKKFLVKAAAARNALLSGDPKYSGAPDEAPEEPFDEYKVLALMAMAGVDMSLLYELPILHLVSVVHEVFALKDPDRKQYRPMTDDELARLYPKKREGRRIGELGPERGEETEEARRDSVSPPRRRESDPAMGPARA